MSKLAILGSGPAGLLTAHAAERAGRSFDIISIPRKSLLPGAMYIHEPIPGVTSTVPDGRVRFIKSGDRAGYAHKVYGSPDAPCSWDKFPEGDRDAWSMAKAYDKVWNMYAHEITDTWVGVEVLDVILDAYESVVSTIPAPSLCRKPDEHEFPAADIYVLDMAARSVAENVIWYNGEPNCHWYRSSNVFGYECTESTTPMPGSSEGRKPIKTNCDCNPTVLRLGRYGEWNKGILAHHVFQKALGRFQIGTEVAPL